MSFERDRQEGQSHQENNGVAVPTKIPDSEVIDRATPRRFSKEEKARILREVDQCKRGEIGAVLRREGINTGKNGLNMRFSVQIFLASHNF